MDELKQQRLKALKVNLSLLNEKLNDFYEELKCASGKRATELQHRIDKEILPAIKRLEDEQNDLTGN